jgi:hypothetical protein
MSVMKIVTISMELVIDDEDCGDSNDSIADYLNDKLFLDPEFFGGFGPENISGVITCVE